MPSLARSWRLRAPDVGAIDERHDLEHPGSGGDLLPLVDVDALEVALLQRAQRLVRATRQDQRARGLLDDRRAAEDSARPEPVAVVDRRLAAVPPPEAGRSGPLPGGLGAGSLGGGVARVDRPLAQEADADAQHAQPVLVGKHRADLFPEYKAQRAKAPDEFKGQIDITKDVLGALGIPVMAEEGFEADDVIATLTTQAEALGYRVLVVTGDRDSLQLVSDDVTVLYPKKGVSDLHRFTPEAVVEKYGLTPTQYPDFAALRGDPSDNLPGIPGVGEKTAAKWINQYGSLQALVDHVDEVKGKVGD